MGYFTQPRGIRRVTSFRQDDFWSDKTNWFIPGDSLTPNREEMFSTHDHVNVANLTTTIHGGWWYTPSGESNLNGVYSLNSTTTNDTIFWNTFQGNETSLKRTEMKIRPFERNLWMSLFVSCSLLKTDNCLLILFIYLFLCTRAVFIFQFLAIY